VRKLAAAGIAGVLAGVGGSAALASLPTPKVPVAHAVRALTAGSPRHPQGVRLTTTFGWHGLSPDAQPMVTNLDLWFPRGSVYNGARYPSCSVQTLDARGPGGCPKGSIMGSGTGTADADTTVTRPHITVVNGGASVVYFYTVLNNPARVQEPVVGHITRLHGQFTYHLSATIPENLRVVAGVPIKLTDLTITAGRGTWLATTNSPAGIKVQTGYDNGATTSYQVWVQDSSA
jgi:hypothetical protein